MVKSRVVSTASSVTLPAGALEQSFQNSARDMTLRAQVAHGLKWQAIDIIGRQFLSLIVFTALARLLEPSAFGMVALVGVYMTFISMFADQGIGDALVQRSNLKPEHLNAAFWFNVACAAFLCAATIVLAGPVSRFLGAPELVPLLRLMS